MKFIIIICLIIPIWQGSTYKLETSSDVKQVILPENSPETPTTIINIPEPHIDVNVYRGPLQNLQSNIPEDANLKKKFNGISYEILTPTDKDTNNYETLDYFEAVKACAKTKRTLLTFKSAEENAFVSKWLFDDLKIVTQVWTSLTRVNGTNDFVWADGSKLTQKNEDNLFKNWDKCEPNDITTTSWNIQDWGEDCVEMYSSYYPYPLRCDEIAKAGQWNDIPCRQIYNIVVCQKVDEKNGRTKL